VRADLDTLLIALYCAACGLFPAERTPRRGRPELISDNELLTLMVAQMLLQCPSDRVFLRRARRRLGHLFPHLPSQSSYNERCRRLTPKLMLLWKALAAETLGSSDDLRLLDTTPLPCGQSIQTTRASELAPWAGFGYCPAHSRRYWGFKLVLLCAPDGTICDFDLVAANFPEREAALALLKANPRSDRQASSRSDPRVGEDAGGPDRADLRQHQEDVAHSRGPQRADGSGTRLVHEDAGASDETRAGRRDAGCTGTRREQRAHARNSCVAACCLSAYRRAGD
jgi:hypothetical protein